MREFTLADPSDLPFDGLILSNGASVPLRWRRRQRGHDWPTDPRLVGKRTDNRTTCAGRQSKLCLSAFVRRGWLAICLAVVHALCVRFFRANQAVDPKSCSFCCSSRSLRFPFSIRTPLAPSGPKGRSSYCGSRRLRLFSSTAAPSSPSGSKGRCSCCSSHRPVFSPSAHDPDQKAAVLRSCSSRLLTLSFSIRTCPVRTLVCA